MYEQFGFNRTPAGDRLPLFVPDKNIDPSQYINGGPCRIVEVKVIGDFQSAVAPTAKDWDYATGFVMTRTQNDHGYLFTCAFPSPLPDGYYQYNYVVKFEDSSIRVIGDPCTKYGGDTKDRSAFVVGGTVVSQNAAATGLANRLPTQDLRIYELMIDDFTKGYRAAKAPLDAVVDKLDYLKGLNVNAVKFMPFVQVDVLDEEPTRA